VLPRVLPRFSSSRALAGIAGLVGLTAFALPRAPARACGQTTHQWITLHAASHLPEGALRDFVERAELRQMLLNGTMFPDGGYPIDDPYGEIAHWEPLQMAYLNWIASSQDPVDAGKGAQYTAFLFGLASHGMSDQLFDSMYMFRTKVYDGEANDLDEASDVVFASLTNPAEVPTDWIPRDELVPLYLDVADYAVDTSQMGQGQLLLRVALVAVGMGSQNPDNVAMYEALYPWGNSHLLDDAVPGTPPCQGEVIARYWRVLWPLVHGESFDGPPVLATFPADATANHETAAADVESMITIVFSRALDEPALSADQFTVEDEGGELAPFDLQLFYGDYSHVVHLKPSADLKPDEVYTVTVAPGVLTHHDELLGGYQFRFSTGDEAPAPLPDANPWDDPEPGTDTDADTDTDTDTSATDSDSDGTTSAGDTDTSAGGDASGSAGDSSDMTEGTGGGTESAGGDDEGEGCGCAGARPGPGGLLLALGLGLGVGRRRRRRR
ncbi:MAG: Ig-like domain-containing protein, partial [Myxococcales bacterium]|nr:Ig-like domain-containing protein [Myxococcales bacterium]